MIVSSIMKMNIELLKKFAKTLNSIFYLIKYKLTMFSNFSAIDFVEDLHEYKSIEDKSVMETFIWSPKFIWSAKFDTKEIGASK